MNAVTRIALAALLALAARSAAATDVSVNFLPETDFTKYHTYFWVKVEGQNVDPITDEQIQRAVDTQLQAKGWKKPDSTEADAYVAYQVAVRQHQELNYYSNYGYGWRWGGSTRPSPWPWRPSRPPPPSNSAVIWWSCVPWWPRSSGSNTSRAAPTCWWMKS